MAPGPDPKGFPRPKMSLELALAMLRLAPWLVLWGFKTDGWPPRPKMSLELALAMLRLAPWLVLWGLTDGPRSRSQRLPQAQNVVGAGFSHAAAGALAGFMWFLNWCAAGPLSGFMGFQNWRMAPGPDLNCSPGPWRLRQTWPRTSLWSRPRRHRHKPWRRWFGSV